MLGLAAHNFFAAHTTMFHNSSRSPAVEDPATMSVESVARAESAISFDPDTK
jgi:hypothetical protein